MAREAIRCEDQHHVQLAAPGGVAQAL